MNFWRDRCVLVTGCTGMLGSWLTAELVAAGADVVGLVRDWAPGSHLVRSGTLPLIKVIRGDVTDRAIVDRALAEYDVDTCFHLAAQTVVGIANRSPVPTFEANIRGTWTVLEAARHWPGLTRLVVASSDKAYGAQPILPYTEEMPLLGSHPYDASKACVDILARTYHHSFGLPVAVTRCANLYGGGDVNVSRLVPGTIRSVLRGEPPIIRSDGKSVREYLYVKDAVAANLRLAERMREPGVAGEAFNFGTGQPVVTRELVELILSLAGRPELTPRVLRQDGIEGEIDRQYLSSIKAAERLGWKARFTLEEGLMETLAWHGRLDGRPEAAPLQTSEAGGVGR